MPSYDSRPPLRQTFGTATRRPTGRTCRGCQRPKDALALPGLCRACLDKQAAQEDHAT